MLPNTVSSTKVFRDFPCAHRQWAHDGHCKFVHGYSRSFHFKFAALELEENTNFVVEFGALKEIKRWLESKFDHTCLINADDPEMEFFQQAHERGVVDLVVLPNVSMEATSKYVADYVNRWLYDNTKGRAWCYEVEVRENEKNSGIWHGNRLKSNPPNLEYSLDPQIIVSKEIQQLVDICNNKWLVAVDLTSNEYTSYSNGVEAYRQGDFRERFNVDQSTETPTIRNF